ncbi:MAG: dual specificity protein phosphatase 23 [Planctomycetota bacterium]|jgi:atypical dual specificity phosphatase
MALNFSFVLPGILAGMEYPGTYSDLDSDLDFLGSKGIKALVNLTGRLIDEGKLLKRNIISKDIPVADFCPPTGAQINEFIKFADKCLAENKPLVVHCGVGQGRTGTMLACYLVRRGRTAEDAIREVRAMRPGSIETRQQEEAIAEFYNTVKANTEK